MPLNTLTLELHWLDVEENKALERKFNSYINACGCDVGGYFTIAGIASSIILGLTGVLDFSWHGIGYGALIAIGFGFAGKTAGLIAARIFFFRLLSKVVATLTF